MTLHLFDTDFHYMMIHPNVSKDRKHLPKNSYWVAQHDEYDDLYVVWDGDPRDYEGYLHFNNVQLGFYKKKYFIDMAEWRDKQIDEILK